MRSRRRFLFAAISATGVAFGAWACSTFSESEPTPLADAAAPDDGVTEAATPPTDAGRDAELLRFGQFDLGCAGWQITNGMGSTTAQALSPDAACLACKAGTSANAVAVTQVVMMPVARGDSFYAVIHARVPEGGSGASGRRISLDTANILSVGSVSDPSGEWEKLDVAHTSFDGGVRVQLIFRFFGDAGDCMIVDDASLVKL